MARLFADCEAALESVISIITGLPCWRRGREPASSAADAAPPLGREGPLEEGLAPPPVLLPGESHGQRSLVGYSPWGRKESDRTE